jgi:hypothetical protein
MQLQPLYFPSPHRTPYLPHLNHTNGNGITGVRKAQAERREGFMAGAMKKRETAFDRARQATLQTLQASGEKDN